MNAVYVLVHGAELRLRAVYTYSSEVPDHPVPDGCSLLRWPLPDAPPLDHAMGEYRAVLDGTGAVIGLRHDPPPPDLPALRMQAEARIDAAAARAMNAVRPVAAARLDAERVRQAELALASPDAYGAAFPLLGGAGSLHERASAVLAAAQATAEQLARIDVARRAAKARIRTATTPAEIEAVTLEQP